MKKKLSIILILAMVLTAVAGCGSSSGGDINGKGVKILLSMSSADTFRDLLAAQAVSTAQNLGATIDQVDCEGLVDKQAESFRQAVDQGYDVIMCAPVDPDTSQELEAIAGDIPVVFLNSAPDESRLTPNKAIYVGSKEAEAGQYQAEYLLDALSGSNELNIAIFKGPSNHSATKGRTSGLKNALKASGKKINYVFEDSAAWSQDIAQQMFEIFLKTGQKCDAVVCNNDSMALGVVAACQAAGKTDIKILGVDATGDGCAAIEAGTMAFTVYQSAVGQGEAGVKAAIALGKGDGISGIEGATDDELYIWVPFEKVDASNVGNYK